MQLDSSVQHVVHIIPGTSRALHVSGTIALFSQTGSLFVGYEGSLWKPVDSKVTFGSQ